MGGALRRKLFRQWCLQDYKPWKGGSLPGCPELVARTAGKSISLARTYCYGWAGMRIPPCFSGWLF